MDMNGSCEIPAPRETVWAALNDIDILKACIPGCESITKHSDTNLEATVVAKVGPVKAKFTGVVTLSDLDPPKGYTISGEGKGGAAGFAKGGATVRLEENGAGTTLHYDVTANVGGKLAQIGSRLIDSAAKKMADQFFSKFSEQAAAGVSAPKLPEDPTPKPKPGSSDLAPAVSAPAKQKPDALNDFRPISFGIWLPIVASLFALGILLLIVG